jgi:hypothetical protein
MVDDIHLTDSSRVADGLSDMLKASIGEHDYAHHYVSVPVALFIVAVAKRAPDHAEWFPRGKWATIQNIESRIEKMLDEIAWEEPTDG